MTKSNLPKARQSNIVLQDLGDELLIYDLKYDRALCLNKIAREVWQACSGSNTTEEIAQVVSKKGRIVVNEALVKLTIKQIKEERLLENEIEFENEFDTLSRREVVKRIGLASLTALPVISAITAPAAVNAQSTCIPIGATCPPNSTNCCLPPVCNNCPPTICLNGGCCLPSPNFCDLRIPNGGCCTGTCLAPSGSITGVCTG